MAACLPSWFRLSLRLASSNQASSFDKQKTDAWSRKRNTQSIKVWNHGIFAQREGRKTTTCENKMTTKKKKKCEETSEKKKEKENKLEKKEK